LLSEVLLHPTDTNQQGCLYVAEGTETMNFEVDLPLRANTNLKTFKFPLATEGEVSITCGEFLGLLAPLYGGLGVFYFFEEVGDESKT